MAGTRLKAAVVLAVVLIDPTIGGSLSALQLGAPHSELTIPGYNTSLGRKVVIESDTAVLLAPYFAEPERTGAAFIATRAGNGWSVPNKLEYGTPSEPGDFAKSAAISGDTLVLGAWSSSAAPGNVQVFVQVAGQWLHQATLTAAGATGGFGVGVAVAGDEIAVGDDGADIVTLYRRQNGVWTQVQQLAPTVPLAGSRYGESVAIEGNLLAVGRPYFPSFQSRKGSVHVYQRADAASPWVEATRFDMLDGGAFPELGYPIEISGGRIVAGAPYYQIANNSIYERRVGAAVVLEQVGGNWTHQLLLPSNAAETGLFGVGLAIQGDRLLVGAPGAAGDRVYSFARGAEQWVETQQLSQPGNGEFGWSLAISGADVIVGAPSFAQTGSAAHLYGTTNAPVPDMAIELAQARAPACGAWPSVVGIRWTSDALYCRARDESVALTSSWAGASCGDLPSTCPDPRNFRKLATNGQTWITLNSPPSGVNEVGSVLTLECTTADGRSARAVAPLVTYVATPANCTAPAFGLAPTLSQPPLALANGTYEMRAAVTNPQSVVLHAIARHGTLGTTHARVEGNELILVYAPDPDRVGGSPLLQENIGAAITDGSFASGQSYTINVNVGLFGNGFE